MGKTTKRKSAKKELCKLREKMRKLEKKLEDSSSSSSDSDSESTNDTNSGSLQGSDADIGHDVLGTDPTQVNEFGPNISEDLARRWRKYLAEGLEKETKSTLLEKTLFPGNCVPLSGPKLNPEVQIMLSPSETKKEGFLLELQSSLGKGLAVLGYTITRLLENKTAEGDAILEDLVKTGQIFCHVHHAVSSHRKFLLYPHMNTKTQKIAALQHPDTLLFGEDFPEKCKAAKTLEGTAKELKASTSKNIRGQATKVRWKPNYHLKQRRGAVTSNSSNRTSYRPKFPTREDSRKRYRKPDNKNR